LTSIESGLRRRCADSAEPRARRQEQTMLDTILIVVGLGFFALSIAYAFGCDRL
jgi:hypothetical protein